MLEFTYTKRRNTVEKIYRAFKSFKAYEVIVILVAIFYAMNRTDSEIQRLERKLDSQNSRTDKLYEMFIDLIKESNNAR